MNTNSQTPAPLLLVTGVSGAGKSSALGVLEDLGYEAVDNLPVSLIGRLLADGEFPHPIAIGIDIRTRDFNAPGFLEELNVLFGRQDMDVKLVFLDCDDEILGRRFEETRRRHPLADDRPISDGLRRERDLMATVRDVQDLKGSLQSQSDLGEDRRTDLRKETDRKLTELQTGLQELAGTLRQMSEKAEADRKATQTDAAQLRAQMDQRLRRLDREVQGIYGVIEKAFSESSDGPAEDSGDVYVIQAGDSLGKIAAKFGCGVAALKTLNSITDPNLIRVGQKLKIPK